MYKAYVKMSPKKYRALEKGRTITVSSKTKEDDPEIELEFNTRKAMNKVHRNLAKGSGVRVKKADLKNMKVVGGDLNKSIRKAFTKAGDKIKEGAFTVNKTLKSNPVSKAVVGTVAPELAGLALQGLTTYVTGSPELGKIASKGATAGVKAGLKSEGYGLRKLVKGKLTPVAETVGGNLGGVTTPAQFNNPESTKRRGRPKKLGGALPITEVQAGLSLGGKQAPMKFNSVSERMAYVRSKRKVGGSFKPLGGSFAPL